MELVLIRGLPGSGKTTVARVLALVGYEHHEAGHYFERDGSYVFDAAELPKAHAWCLERAQDSMAPGFIDVAHVHVHSSSQKQLGPLARP